MYQRAQKIHQLITTAALFAELAEDELEAYLIAINALSLLDAKDAWIVLPIVPGSHQEVSCYLSGSLHAIHFFKAPTETSEAF
jgi:hypothetical protein